MSKQEKLQQEAKAVEQLITRIIELSEGKLSFQQAAMLLRTVIEEIEKGIVKELLLQMMMKDTKLSKEKVTAILEEITLIPEQETYQPFKQQKLKDLYNKLKEEES